METDQRKNEGMAKKMSEKNENLSLSYRADTLSATLLCEVDHHKAKPLREAIDRAAFAYRPRVLALDFSAVRSVNLDEYYPISPENAQSYRYFMNKNLFDRVNIDKANTAVPNGAAEDPEAECRAYEEKLAALGQVDVQVLGIGQNGHIAFNEPDENLIAVTHLTNS